MDAEREFSNGGVDSIGKMFIWDEALTKTCESKKWANSSSMVTVLEISKCIYA